MQDNAQLIDQTLYEDQVNYLYAGLNASLLANLLNALIFAAVLFKVSSPTTLILWVFFVFIISASRFILSKIFQGLPRDATFKPSRWGNFYITGLMSSALAWGFAGYYFFPPQSTSYQIFIAFVLGGMVVAATISMSSIKHVFLVYMLIVLVPLLSRFFQAHDEIHTGMAVMLLVFMLYSLLLSREVYRIIRKSFLLGYKNEQEIQERLRAENELIQHQEELENIVIERTRELQKINADLHDEIAERRVIEKQLLVEKNKLEVVTENMRVGLCVISREYRILWANKIMMATYGDTAGKCCHSIFKDQQDVCSPCSVKKIFDEQLEEVRTEVAGKDLEGNTIYSEIIATPIYDDYGKISSALKVVVPITESRQREKILGELLALSKILSSTTHLPIIYREVDALAKTLLRLDFSTIMLLAEDKAGLMVADTIGFAAENIGKTFKLDEHGLATYVLRERESREVINYDEESRFTVPPFINKYNITSALCVPMVIGAEVFGVMIGHTISQRKFSDSELSLYQTIANMAAVAVKNAMHLHSLVISENKFRTIFNSTHDAIMIYDPSAKLIEVNKVACERLGYTREELLQMNASQFITPEYAALLPERLEKLKKVDTTIFETAHVRKDGSIVPVELSLQRIQFENKPALLGMGRDISERLKWEEERLRTQKLESLGVFAGGIAHDFNNLLTGILANISLARLQAKNDYTLQKSLVDTEKAALRAKDLTKQLLTFSKGGTPLKNPSAIAEIIRDSAGFAMRGSRSVCAYDFAENLWKVNADRGQLSQVFQNLVLNASQAMPEGGVVNIRARNVVLKQGEVPHLTAGNYVSIMIQDHGVGITKNNREKIFDPYFTTKQGGSGLGLAVVYSIINKHGGHISLESETGRGTTFTLFIPAIIGDKVESAPAGDEIFAGQGKILFMDDEELLRDVAERILQELGFEPHLVADGIAAVELYKKAMEEGAPFDVVIMDLTVPGGMGGKETIQRLLEIDPTVSAIVSSGYAHDPIMANYTEYGFKGVVPKPFTLQQLSSVLHKVMNGSAAHKSVVSS